MEEGTESVRLHDRANGANGEVAEPDQYLNNGPEPRPRGGSAFAERGDVAPTRFSRLGVGPPSVQAHFFAYTKWACRAVV